MTIKNDAWQFALRDLPRILAAELPRLVFLAFSQPRTLLALADLARAWPGALRKRRQIRSHRLVSDRVLWHRFIARSTRRPDDPERGSPA
jgi:hypothetical protein